MSFCRVFDSDAGCILTIPVVSLVRIEDPPKKVVAAQRQTPDEKNLVLTILHCCYSEVTLHSGYAVVLLRKDKALFTAVRIDLSSASNTPRVKLFDRLQAYLK